MLAGVSPESKRDLLLSVGSHRDDRPLSPEEVARAFHAAIDSGSTLADLAALVHFDGTSMVSRFLRVLKLPSDVLRIVGWGQSSKTIPFTSASEISRLKHSGDQVDLAVAALASDLTTSEVKAIVQMKLRSAESIHSCIEAITRLRSATIRRHVIMGAITNENLKNHLAALSQNQRDHLLALALEEVLSSDGNIAGKLSHERFTLTTENEQSARTLSNLPGGMESAITTAVQMAVDKKGAL